MAHLVDSFKLAQQWLQLDQDPSTRKEIEDLVAKGDHEELNTLLRTRISFGTAGLRARMQAGFSRMNCVTVIQTSQGLAQYLLDNIPNAAAKGVVIGHDARHNSKRFAQLAAAAFAAKGFSVNLYDSLVHTPLVPFCVGKLGCAGGVMVTASHNPKQDNGYKVYNSQGCQINTPVDKAIAASILENLEIVTWDTSMLPTPKALVVDIEKQYYAEAAKLLIFPLNTRTLPRFVYTPLHGVGWHFMIHALNEVVWSGNQKYSSAQEIESLERDLSQIVSVVPTQELPDAEFPTVDFPNPEEVGALDLAMALADRKDIKLILANDPDADRFVAAEKLETEWKQFTGDQLGVLLGYHIWKNAPTTPTDQVMFTSAVSSQMLAKIGRAEGFEVQDCLTGFKWIGSRALEYGDRAIFGYEEALGYMTPSVVHDKDGITAALLFLELCSVYGSPWKLLQNLYAKYGHFVTVNTYWKSSDTATTLETFSKIRRWAISREAIILQGVSYRYRDLTTGYDSDTADKKPTLPMSADAQMITFWLTEAERGVRWTIRASGTEPKIKVYIECYSPNGHDAAQNAGIAILSFISEKWFTGEGVVMDTRYESELSRQRPKMESDQKENFWT